MKVVAKAKGLPISAQKLRLIVASVRGKSVNTALEQLMFMPQKGAKFSFDVIKSAQANASHNYKLNPDTLVIESISVDKGTTLKRYKPRSKGMTSPIEHQSSHLTVVVEDQAVEKLEKPAKKESK